MDETFSLREGHMIDGGSRCTADPGRIDEGQSRCFRPRQVFSNVMLNDAASKMHNRGGYRTIGARQAQVF